MTHTDESYYELQTMSFIYDHHQIEYELNQCKAMLAVLKPTPQFIIPVIVPYGGEIMDALGFSIYPSKSIHYFDSFCRQILRKVYVSQES